MPPGRNDPCPCGSGKKYKKCCLGKTPAVAKTEVPPAVEPRFMSPVSSFYTQGALMEALKPGGTVHIHPYVLLKLRDDPRMLDSATPETRRQLQKSWLPSKLAAMSLEEIAAQLGRLGVPYDRTGFIAAAKSHQSAWVLGTEWTARLGNPSGDDGEFIGLAACELWRRLCADHPSLELIDDWLCEGYGLVGQGKRAEGLTAWSKVWDALRPRLSAKRETLSDAGERIFPRMSQCLTNWVQDLTMEAMNGALMDAQCGEIGLRVLRELIEVVPDDEALSLLGDLAMLHFNLRRDAEGEQLCQQLIRDHPDRAVGYATLEQGLLRDSYRGAPDPTNIRRAIALLEQALAYPVKDVEAFDLPSRLEDARKLLAKAAPS
jgi:hypothetical protein